MHLGTISIQTRKKSFTIPNALENSEQDWAKATIPLVEIMETLKKFSDFSR